jgi:hypothetical protein
MRWRGWVTAALHDAADGVHSPLEWRYVHGVERAHGLPPARDNANLAQGVRTLRYGWPDVTEYRCRTAAEIAEVLRCQGWTGTLRRCGPACTAVPPRKQGGKAAGGQ